MIYYKTILILSFRAGKIVGKREVKNNTKDRYLCLSQDTLITVKTLLFIVTSVKGR